MFCVAPQSVHSVKCGNYLFVLKRSGHLCGNNNRSDGQIDTFNKEDDDNDYEDDDGDKHYQEPD